MKYTKNEYRSIYCANGDDETDPETHDCPERIRDYDWFQAFAYAPEDVEREDVAEVIHAVDGARDGDSWVGVFKLKDGRFCYLTAGCDYTGWDCRAGGHGETRATLEEIIRECVTEDDARRFGIEKKSADAL
jgi:hypothetical protein